MSLRNKLESLYITSENVKLCSQCEKTDFSKSSLLGIRPGEIKTYVPEKTCTQMFIAALFIIAYKCNKPCLSIDEWVNKLWYAVE